MTFPADSNVSDGMAQILARLAAGGEGYGLHPLAAETKLPVRRGDDFDNDVDGPPWLIPGLIAKSSLTELTASPKAGKSTLIAGMTRALLDGGDFLNRPCALSPVLWASEQSSVSLAATVSGASLRGDPRFRYLLRCDIPLNEPWPEVVEDMAEYCKTEGVGVLFIDTLSPWCRLTDENDSGQAVRAIEPLRQAAGQGLAVVTARHARKSGGSISHSGRGSSAFAGEADILLSLTRPEGSQANVRRLEVLGRFGYEEPINWALEDDGRIILCGSDPKKGSHFDSLKVLEVIRNSSEPMSMVDICLKAEIARSSVQVILEGLTRKKSIHRIGSGRKGDPYHYETLELR